MGCHVYLYEKSGHQIQTTPWIRIGDHYGRRFDTREKALKFVARLRREAEPLAPIHDLTKRREYEELQADFAALETMIREMDPFGSLRCG